MNHIRVVLAFGLFAAIALLQLTHDAPRVNAAPVAPGNRAGIRSLAQLPIPAQAVISESLGRGGTSYHAQRVGDSWRLEHVANGAHALFGAHGAVVQFDGAEWNMGLRAWGFGKALHATRAQMPSPNANRVAYARGALTEGYVNGALGLQQGFTVNAPAQVSNADVLTLAVALPRALRAELQLQLVRDTKDYALNTSLKNYIDPRVHKDWGERVGYHWKKLYTGSLQRKFTWAMQDDSNGADASEDE